MIMKDYYKMSSRDTIDSFKSDSKTGLSTKVVQERIEKNGYNIRAVSTYRSYSYQKYSISKKCKQS